jgi:hypothetical protein
MSTVGDYIREVKYIECIDIHVFDDNGNPVHGNTKIPMGYGYRRAAPSRWTVGTLEGARFGTLPPGWTARIVDGRGVGIARQTKLASI